MRGWVVGGVGLLEKWRIRLSSASTGLELGLWLSLKKINDEYADKNLETLTKDVKNWKAKNDKLVNEITSVRRGFDKWRKWMYKFLMSQPCVFTPVSEARLIVIRICDQITTVCLKKRCHSFCLISLATNMLEGWDIFELMINLISLDETPSIDKNCHQKLWTKVEKKYDNNSYEQTLLSQLMYRSCEQKLITKA